MTDEVFDIRMEKVNDHTSDSKYAIIGYFAEKQRKQNEVISDAASDADPEAALETPTQPKVDKQSPDNGKPADYRRKAHHSLSNILAESTAEQWLLVLIAFMLFINLICKSS